MLLFIFHNLIYCIYEFRNCLLDYFSYQKITHSSIKVKSLPYIGIFLNCSKSEENCFLGLDNSASLWYYSLVRFPPIIINGMWLSLVERFVRDEEVACSNHVIPTKFKNPASLVYQGLQGFCHISILNYNVSLHCLYSSSLSI